MLLSAEHISKNYGTRQLLEDVSLYLEEGAEDWHHRGSTAPAKAPCCASWRGVEESDSGTLSRDPNVQISYLPQNPAMEEGATVLEQVFLRQSPGSGP